MLAFAAVIMPRYASATGCGNSYSAMAGEVAEGACWADPGDPSCQYIFCPEAGGSSGTCIIAPVPVIVHPCPACVPSGCSVPANSCKGTNNCGNCTLADNANCGTGRICCGGNCCSSGQTCVSGSCITPCSCSCANNPITCMRGGTCSCSGSSPSYTTCTDNCGTGKCCDTSGTGTCKDTTQTGSDTAGSFTQTCTCT